MKNKLPSVYLLPGLFILCKWYIILYLFMLYYIILAKILRVLNIIHFNVGLPDCTKRIGCMYAKFRVVW